MQSDRTRIKICGLRREADAVILNRVRPDFAGFIFVRRRTRYVRPEDAARIRSVLDPGIKTVGVFIDEPVENAAALCREGIISLVQLHGSEDEEYIRHLREQVSCGIIQAFRIRGPEDMERALLSSADYLLLDAGAGDGKTFDWSLIPDLKRPWFLAGGLDPDNIGGAILRCRPWGVDVSSGVETDGFKDPEKIRRFIEAARTATIR